MTDNQIVKFLLVEQKHKKVTDWFVKKNKFV